MSNYSQACSICGSDYHKDILVKGICPSCRNSNLSGAFESPLSKHQKIVESVMLTTETAHDFKIIKRIEIVTAEVAYGMHFFKDLFAQTRDIVGGRSKAVQKTMRDARRTALYELKEEAQSVGANAVVGVNLNYVELSSGGTMIMLVASGTAVIIE